MMALAMPWWRDRSGREQLLLSLMAALVVIVIGWLGIIRPLAIARDAAIERLATSQRDLGDVRAMTPAIRAAEKRANPVGGVPTLERIRERVSAAGLTVERLASDGDGRVTMRVPAVKPAILLRWIADIETRDAIIVDRLAISRNGDATVAADIAFRDRGR